MKSEIPSRLAVSLIIAFAKMTSGSVFGACLKVSSSLQTEPPEIPAMKLPRVPRYLRRVIIKKLFGGLH